MIYGAAICIIFSFSYLIDLLHLQQLNTPTIAIFTTIIISYYHNFDY